MYVDCTFISNADEYLSRHGSVLISIGDEGAIDATSKMSPFLFRLWSQMELQWQKKEVPRWCWSGISWHASAIASDCATNHVCCRMERCTVTPLGYRTQLHDSPTRPVGIAVQIPNWGMNHWFGKLRPNGSSMKVYLSIRQHMVRWAVRSNHGRIPFIRLDINKRTETENCNPIPLLHPLFCPALRIRARIGVKLWLRTVHFHPTLERRRNRWE